MRTAKTKTYSKGPAFTGRNTPGGKMPAGKAKVNTAESHTPRTARTAGKKTVGTGGPKKRGRY